MILDIKTLADTLTQEVRENVKQLKQKPHLTIVMVGNNSASEVYVRNKLKMCENVGIGSQLLHLEESISEDELLENIKQLNQDENVTGILVQSPLPKQINAQTIFDTIDTKKDVDGFSTTNIARLYSGDESWLIPGTPKGIMYIIEHYFQTKGNEKIEGKHAVVIGKSTIVGKPLAMLLLHAGATVTVCHSRTQELSEHTKQADIVISAVGKKHLITADMIQPGSLIIDVGINVETNDTGKKLFGDCDTENIEKIADVTPVPGGVGPMTIAMLLSNVLRAHEIQGKQ
ncbi:bifunctional 5,10-methylenetetrahydrofolate dehydrogenase/5,10-methenyltetrahydrofolate cyclohydrolase [Candidatus Gracilibacteria bacterium]|nr:bifunctional 5,10-methylenetetrahydrofolate dehydrogenase/5,10-methenyltetrahydrofolate cyclohydrolase [Candidatus Gracilibacteria bacterium]